MARKHIESENWTTFLWDIENFCHFWNKYFGHISSPAFEVNLIEEISWNIRLFHSNRFKNTIICELGASRVRGSQYTVVEYDSAILAEDGSVLQMYERIIFNVDAEADTSEFNVREADLSRDTLRLRCRVRRTDGKAMTPATYFARTALSVKKRNFLWEIERFSSFEPDQKVTHAIRSNVEENEMTLKIKVNTEGKIMIFIDSYEPKIEFLKFQSFIIDTNRSKVDCEKYENISGHFRLHEICVLPFTQKCLMQNQHLYLKNDVLSVYCECSWCDMSSLTGTVERIDFGISPPWIRDEIGVKSYSPPTEVKQCDEMIDLKEDLKCLYDEGILSDVKLRTTTQTFHAHKAILSARSPVFRRMFSIDMKEKIQESVDILGFEDDTLRRLLQYLYINTLEDLQWENALNLYAAADKYGIVCLKSKCSSFLKSNLCPNNVCDVLVLADMHGDDDLKGVVQNYILKHEEGVYSSDEWKVFAKNNTLAVEIMLLKWSKQ
ncbi:TD and POZ domain-containing protein 3 [Trichonephila clavata]|uniref:TD and POZ domain-containing protein 3 n=1 Tax=Trichonephila clavata TaxID=2740835 RepID=A0A8X6GC98_TRICU|nr:TD and POZ domain-containing protein 3 [Trichonephila clavata]